MEGGYRGGKMWVKEKKSGKARDDEVHNSGGNVNI